MHSHPFRNRLTAGDFVSASYYGCKSLIQPSTLVQPPLPHPKQDAKKNAPDGAFFWDCKACYRL